MFHPTFKIFDFRGFAIKVEKNDYFCSKLVTLGAKLNVNEDLWKEVLKFKIDNDLKNNNEAVVKLIEKGLKNNHL